VSQHVSVGLGPVLASRAASPPAAAAAAWRGWGSHCGVEFGRSRTGEGSSGGRKKGVVYGVGQERRCLMVLNLEPYTPQWIRQSEPCDMQDECVLVCECVYFCSQVPGVFHSPDFFAHALCGISAFSLRLRLLRLPLGLTRQSDSQMRAQKLYIQVPALLPRSGIENPQHFFPSAEDRLSTSLSAFSTLRRLTESFE
jgi:hypothetical protein